MVGALDRVDYKGFLCIELGAYLVEPETAALESIQYMDSLRWGV